MIQFGANVAPIGAANAATGYDAAWKVVGADEYIVWSTDNGGNYIGSPTGAVSGENIALEDLEPSLRQDLNGDGRLSNMVITTPDATTRRSMGWRRSPWPAAPIRRTASRCWT